jgi:hypothetical protein
MTEVVRVVYDNRPYMVIRDADGSLAGAYGPFIPGTEPNLAECSSEHEVRSASLLASLEDLLPLSPPLPPSEGTLAGG